MHAHRTGRRKGERNTRSWSNRTLSRHETWMRLSLGYSLTTASLPSVSFPRSRWQMHSRSLEIHHVASGEKSKSADLAAKKKLVSSDGGATIYPADCAKKHFSYMQHFTSTPPSACGSDRLYHDSPAHDMLLEYFGHGKLRYRGQMQQTVRGFPALFRCTHARIVRRN